ncbi:hypothetical protein [Niabella hirudinis]|uniref:hypothetical protein n=1 Tax=Niabella hirudinis TaxID=1285929 RepID=UPI003EBE0CBD
MKFVILITSFVFLSFAGLCQQAPPKTSQTKSSAKPSKITPQRQAQAQQLREKKSNELRMDRSKKIADKMTDSLGLSQTQRADIININAGIEQQKALAFKSDTSRAIVGRELQRIEKGRDNLYKSVLTEKQYQIYSRSKMNLINPLGPKKKE